MEFRLHSLSPSEDCNTQPQSNKFLHILLSDPVNYENKLLEDLMKGYNRNARPTVNVLKPIDVSIGLYLTKLLGLVSQINDSLS